MIYITNKNFENQILKSPLPILLLWGMQLDVNSNQIALKLQQLDSKRVSIARIDVDASPDLVMRYSVRQCPLIMLIVNGLAIAQDTKLSDDLLKKAGVFPNVAENI